MTNQPEQPNPSPAPPPRFTLAGLFELIAGVALFLGLLVELGFFGFGIAGLAGIVIFAADHVIFAANRRQAWQNMRLGCMFLCVLALLVMCLLPAVSVSRPAARSSWCSNNLRQLALALHEYHDDHGHFPPPYIADATGKPMHSWRVLILPYLELRNVHDAYNFKEPWDGPNNSKLASPMPPTFRCPSDTRMPPNMTNYFYIVGKSREKPDGSPLQASDVKDGTMNTILLVESKTARVNWMEPRDLTIEEVIGDNNAEGVRAASSHHVFEDPMWRSNSRIHVAMYDASVHALPEDVEAETLRALLSIDGGEAVELPDFSDRQWHLRPEFFALVSLAVAFVVLAILRRVRLARHKGQLNDQAS